jgi:hypothetical protein
MCDTQAAEQNFFQTVGSLYNLIIFLCCSPCQASTIVLKKEWCTMLTMALVVLLAKQLIILK